MTDVPPPESKDTALAHEDSLLALQILESQIEHFRPRQTTVELVANELPLILGVERLLEQWKDGMVVAGMTGKGSVGKFLVGSHTAALADACSAPVLIVPDKAELVEPVIKAVLASDLKTVDKTIPLGMIDEIVTKLGADLLVLNVERVDTRLAGDVIPEQYKLHEKLDHLNPEYHYTAHKDIAKGIMDFAEAQQAGLVMAMPRSHGLFDSLFHRSVTKKLAHHTRLPLLLLRPAQN